MLLLLLLLLLLLVLALLLLLQFLLSFRIPWGVFGVFKSYQTLLSYQASGHGWERALSSVRWGMNALLLGCSLHCIYTCIGLLSSCSPARRAYRQTRRVSQLSGAFSDSERTLSSVRWDMDAHAPQDPLSSLVPSETQNVHFLL